MQIANMEVEKKILYFLHHLWKRDTLVLYGRYGHEGKSMLLRTLTNLIPKAGVWCQHDLFGKNAVWLRSELISYLAQKRSLICDECDIREGFSYNNTKRWTSGTPVTLKDLRRASSRSWPLY